MDRYIKQLQDDIKNATLKIRPPHEIWEDANPDDEVELEDISHVEKYYYGKKEPIEQITGIRYESLPPTALLTKQQQAILAVDLEELLKYFHFSLDFPVNFPENLRYEFIRNFWQEEHVPISFGESHIEFCDYDDENCPFPGYCNSCDEFRQEMKRDKDIIRKNRNQNSDEDFLF